MKLWQKFIVVFVCMGTIGGFSLLISVKPDMAPMLAAVNTAIAAVCAYFAGYPAPKEA